MKTIDYILKISLIGVLLFGVYSCEDEYELEEKPAVDQLQFSIVQDYDIDPGGNTVIVTNNTPGTTAVWDYGTGKSYKVQDTIQYAFAGEYSIQFTAVTDGGLVDADPVTVSVTDDNLSYVSDPLWIMLSGGPGNSKTWVLDVDENGQSKYFTGPMFFFGTDNGWLMGGEPFIDAFEGGCYGEDCWNWSPDLGGIQGWGFSGPGDFGEMTFSLEGGPYLTVEHLMQPEYGSQSGTYYLDKDNHTLTTSGATILHDSAYEDCVDDWNSIVVLSLTEDYMQLGVIRDCDPAMLSYNFISKEYADNWTPPEPEDPEPDEGFQPTFEEGELLQILTGGPAAGRYWKLDETGNPVDWLAGGIGWTTDASSSYNWGWNDDWTATAENSYIRFDQYGGTQNYFKNENGVESSGTFTIDQSESGDYATITLSDGGTLIQSEGSWLSPTTSTITVVKAVPDDFENFGLWFGTSYNPDNDEWTTFHYIINNNVTGGGGGDVAPPGGTEVVVDNSLIDYGDLEMNGNLRIELYNDFGSTAANPPLDTSELVFGDRVEVTFTISGTGLDGNYDASIYYADADWSPNGNGETINVTGDGTYTVTFDPDSAVDGNVVFVIDIVGMATDIADINAVTATIDSVYMFD